MMWIRDRLIDDWNQAWRFWSVRMQALGALLTTLMVMVPAMPPEIQALVPVKYRVIALGLWAAASIASRLIKQQPKS